MNAAEQAAHDQVVRVYNDLKAMIFAEVLDDRRLKQDISLLSAVRVFLKRRD